MPDESIAAVAQTAAVASAAGAAARVVVAALGGTRGWQLVFEALVGAALGVIAAAFAVWASPELRAVGWPTMILGGVAGLAGALGNRGLDMLIAYIERHVKGSTK